MIYESERKMTYKEQEAYDLGYLNGKRAAICSPWVKTEDRLPEPYEHVLTYDDDIREGYLTRQGHWMGKWNGASDTVTHWMPMPEPPDEEVEE